MIDSLVVLLLGIAATLMSAFVSSLYARKEDEARESRELLLDRVKQRIIESSPGERLNEALALQGAVTDDERLEISEQVISQVRAEILEDLRTNGTLPSAEIDQAVEHSIQEVRERVASIEERFPSTDSIDKIASINDALLAERIQHLQDRVKELEATQLSRWDVAKTVSLLAAGVIAVVGATYAVLKTFGAIS